MSQNNIDTGKESSFSIVSSFSHSINKSQYSKIQNYLSSKLGSLGTKKHKYTYWEEQNTKNDIYEIRFYKNKIKIEYSSKVEKSSAKKFINDLILDITNILDGV
jgi:hypothetical protein